MGSSDKCSIMELQALLCFVLLGLATLISGADLGGGHGGHENYEYSPYHYEYNVDDDKEYLHFGQEEEDDGTGNVHGYYHVQLPDGRLQRVDYHVSGYSGYIADVKYDGEAHHPSHHGGGHHGGGGHHLGGNVHGGHHNTGHHAGGSLHTGHLGGSGRLGKAVNVEQTPVTEVKPIRTFVHTDTRQSGFGDSSPGVFGGSSRLGKAATFQSEKPSAPKPAPAKKSSLITRKRIERPERFEVAASEQVTTVHKPTTFFSEPALVSPPVKVPTGPSKPLFEFRNAHNQIQTFQQAHEEARELRNSQHIIGNIQHIPQEVQQLQGAQRQIQDLQRIQHETQGLINSQHHIKSLQNIQHEVHSLKNGQRQIQNIQNVQREFQSLQNAQTQIKDVQQAERISSNSRFPSLIKHHVGAHSSKKSSSGRPGPSQDNFPVRIVGRVIQTP